MISEVEEMESELCQRDDAQPLHMVKRGALHFLIQSEENRLSLRGRVMSCMAP